MHSLSKLFLSLAEIYIAENRNGANLSSQALIQASSEINTPKLLQNQFSIEVKSVGDGMVKLVLIDTNSINLID